MSKTTTICVKCGSETETARKSLCPRCYLMAHSGRDMLGECECCGHADPRVLVRRHIDDEESFVLCANCATIQWPRKLRLDALIKEVNPPGDRRQNNRRSGKERRQVALGAHLAPRIDQRRAANR